MYGGVYMSVHVCVKKIPRIYTLYEHCQSFIPCNHSRGNVIVKV